MLSLTSLTASAQATVSTREREKKAAALKPGSRASPFKEEPDTPLRVEWRPVALVFRMERWTCRCGVVGHTNLGLFLYQEHLHLTSATRLAACGNDAEHPSLPRHYLHDEHAVTMCEACCGALGYATALPHGKTFAERVAKRAPGSYIEQWRAARAATGEGV